MSQDILALAFEGHPIRTTNETPKRISVIDVLAAVGYGNPRQKWSDISSQFPEVVRPVDNLTFPGRGQKPTPVIDREGALRLVMILEGPKAAAFREWASSILVRYLDGDRTLAQEIHLRADLEEDNELPMLSAAEIFDEAAPGVMEVLADKALRGSVQAARLLLQYRNTIQPKLPEAPAEPRALSSVAAFWLECLRTGRIGGYSFAEQIPISAIIDAYCAHAGIVRTRALEPSFGIQLRKLCRVSRQRVMRDGVRQSWHYSFPSLAECRRLFASATGVEVQS